MPIRIAAALFCASLLLSAGPLPAAGGVTLEWKWEKGQTYRYRAVTDKETRHTESESAEPETESGKAIQAWRFEVLDVSRRGVGALLWTYELAEDVDVLIERPLKLSVDARGRVVQEPDLSGIAKDLLDEYYEEILGARPEEMDKEELETSFEEVLELLEGLTGEDQDYVSTEEMARPALVRLVTDRFGEVIEHLFPVSLFQEMILRSMRSSFDFLPGRPVEIGESWTRSREFHLPVVEIRGQQELSFTLEKVGIEQGERRARVAFQGRGDTVSRSAGETVLDGLAGEALSQTRCLMKNLWRSLGGRSPLGSRWIRTSPTGRAVGGRPWRRVGDQGSDENAKVGKPSQLSEECLQHCSVLGSAERARRLHRLG